MIFKIKYAKFFKNNKKQEIKQLSISLGDSENDKSMLELKTDYSCCIKSPKKKKLYLKKILIIIIVKKRHLSVERVFRTCF